MKKTDTPIKCTLIATSYHLTRLAQFNGGGTNVAACNKLSDSIERKLKCLNALVS